MIHRIQAIRLTDYQKLDYQIIKMQNPVFARYRAHEAKKFCN